MKIDLKNGSVIGINIDTDLKDNEKFNFNGKILYSNDNIDNYSKYLTLTILGKGKILKDFKGVEIEKIIFDDDIKKQIEKVENFENFLNIIKNELNNYQTLEKLSIQKMKFKEDNKLTFNIENVKIDNIEYIEFTRKGTLKISIYTNRKSDISEINIFSSVVNVEYNSNDLKVINIKLNSVFEIEEYEKELLKEYLSYFVENNNYIKDYFNSQRLKNYFTF